MSVKHRCKICLEIVYSRNPKDSRYFIQHWNDNNNRYMSLFDPSNTEINDDWCVSQDWDTNTYECKN